MSYALEDAHRLTDGMMVLLAREYMEKMGIKDRMSNIGSLGTFEEKQKGQLFDFQIIALSRSTRSRAVVKRVSC